MARTPVTPTQIARTGIAAALSAANVDGHSVPNNGRMFIEIVNGAGSPITVTIPTPNTVDGQAITDRTVSVTNGERRLIGPFPPSVYNQSDATIYVDFSDVTTINFGAFYL